MSWQSDEMPRRNLPHPRELRAAGALCCRCGDVMPDIAAQRAPAPGYSRLCPPCATSLAGFNRTDRQSPR